MSGIPHFRYTSCNLTLSFVHVENENGVREKRKDSISTSYETNNKKCRKKTIDGLVVKIFDCGFDYGQNNSKKKLKPLATSKTKRMSENCYVL